MSRPKVLGAMAMLVLAAGAAHAAGGEVYHTRLRKFNVGYDLKEAFADLKRVELWITLDGGRSWSRVGIDNDTKSPVGFQASSEGTHGFKTIGIDAAGNSQPKPTRGTKPDVSVIVDWTPPKVSCRAPSSTIAAPGGKVDLSYTAADAYLRSSPIVIECSTDRGATWKAVASGLRNTGSASATLPGVHGDEVLLRVVAFDRAGNSGAAKAPRGILLDGMEPTVTITGPRSARGDRVTVTYKASDDGKAGLKEVRLYASSDGGASWKLASTDTDLDGRIAYTVGGPGSLSFHAVAVDKVGNESAAPAPGTKPMHVVMMDTQAPTVVLKSTGGSALAGGSRQKILWEATDDNMAAAPITISYSTDGGKGWKVVARRLRNTGEYVWSVPSVNSRECLVKVEAVDEFNNRSQAVSQAAFVVATRAPETRAFFDPNQSGEVVMLPVDEPVRTGTTDTTPAVERPVVKHPVIEEPRGVSQKKLELAAGFIETRRFADAVELMTKELGSVPDSPPALVLRGRAYLGLKKNVEAKADLMKAVEVDKGNREAWLQLGVAHFRAGKDVVRTDRASARTEFGKAVRAYERAIGVAIVNGGEGSDVEYYYCGMAYYQLFVLDRKRGPNGQQALDKLLRAVKIGGQASTMGGACWYIGKLYQARGDDAKEREYWKKTADYYSGDDATSRSFRQKAMEYYRQAGGR